MKEQTDTHRRCMGPCREWKWMHEFKLTGPGQHRRWVCYQCQLARNRERYAHKSTAELDAILATQRKNAVRRRKVRGQKWRESAEFYVERLLAMGLTKTEIQDRYHVTRRTILDVQQGRKSYLRKATVEKLRDAFMREASA